MRTWLATARAGVAVVVGLLHVDLSAMGLGLKAQGSDKAGQDTLGGEALLIVAE